MPDLVTSYNLQPGNRENPILIAPGTHVGHIMQMKKPLNR